MAQIKYFALSIFLVVSLTIPLRAQVLKNDICPDPANQPSAFSGQQPAFIDKMPASNQSDEINPFSNRISSPPQYSPALLSATSIGAGAVGTFPIGEPLRGIGGNYILRISLLNIYPSMFSSPNLSSPGLQGALMPVEFGLRVPFINSMLGALGYTLYGETSAGLLLGMVLPTNGSFLSYSLPNSRFTTGASAYAGIGNTLRMDKYVGVYLNGGVGYFDLFSSSFLPRTNYFMPLVSVGFYFNIGR